MCGEATSGIITEGAQPHHDENRRLRCDTAGTAGGNGADGGDRAQSVLASSTAAFEGHIVDVAFSFKF